MTGKFTFEDGIGGNRQMAECGNATQTTLGNDQRSISIMVVPAFPDGTDITDRHQVEAHMADVMQPLVDAGFEITVHYGKFE